MPLVECPECHGQVSTSATSCPHCGYVMKKESRNREERRSRRPRSERSNRVDSIIYEDQHVMVSTSKVTVRGTIYALRNITSVKRVKIAAKYIAFAYILMLLGGMSLIGYLITPELKVSVDSVGLSFVIFLIGLAINLTSKPKYVLVISSSSGEQNALASKNPDYIDELVAAIEEAISDY